MAESFRRLLVTGGAGFIGSAFVRRSLAHHDGEVVVLDKLTYAGNLGNLAPVAADPRYHFVQGDIADPTVVAEAMAGCDGVVNFAAETHVDRSLIEPGSFIRTDVHGTWVLLEEARRLGVRRFVQVSTDEVYGSIEHGSSVETDALQPRSPYSASKAGGEMQVMAYHETWGLPAMITRGSNTYGPYQYPEKVLPLFITNALEDRALPLYGDGLNVRDWLHVDDHCAGIDAVLRRGQPGAIYNIGGGNERTNLELTRRMLALLGKPESLIRFVTDRPGHDRRYSLDCAKAHTLGWRPVTPFEDGLRQTVEWYATNRAWWEPIKSGEYAAYYQQQYAHR
ncbi:MAG: dTDP-glucose 4,6-dehydratase [Chloroflexi bacterium]|nr:dTDP-glucose 4,6-dehydratase [Chloroflexota bacterium]